MKSSDVTIKLSMEQEFELMNKYGRRCSREGLVMRAVQDAVKNGTEPKVAKARKSRKKKGDEPSQSAGHEHEHSTLGIIDLERNFGDPK